MSCPNINSPEWKALVNKIGEMNAWKEFYITGQVPSSDNYDIIDPIVEEKSSIKEGVEELFESNSELANAVYEALGFEIPTTKLKGRKAVEGKLVNFDVIEELASAERSDIPSSILIKKLLNGGYLPKINETDIVLGGLEYGIWRPNLKKIEAQGGNKSTLAKKVGHELLHSVTHNIIYSYQNLKGVVDFNDKYNKDNIRQGYIKPVDLTKSQIEALDNLVRIRNKVVAYVEQNKDKIQKQDRGFGTYDYFIRTNYTESETDLHEFISEVFTNPELINILKEIPSEGKKSNLFKDFVDAIAKILGFTNTSILEDVIAYSEEAFFAQTQITPQQKQQALQAYSQYLATVFPDSQVKDIVYHGTDAQFDKFDKNIKKISDRNIPNTANAYFFTNDLNRIKDYGKNKINIILNAKEPLNFKNIDNDRARVLSNITYEKAKGYTDTNIDSVIADYDLYKDYIVFEPEQIHTLGGKQDIEGFKEFVSKPKDSVTSVKFIDNKSNTNKDRIINLNSNLKSFIYTNSDLNKDTLEFIYDNLDSDMKDLLKKENVNFVEDFNKIGKKTTLYQKILDFIKKLFFKTSLEKVYMDLKKENPLEYLTENANFTLFGLSENQKLNKTIVNNTLNYIISPLNYNWKRVIKKAVINVFNNPDYNSFKEFLKSEYEKEKSDVIVENIKLPTWVLDITEEDYNKRHDAWRLSNGLPQKHNSFYYIGRNEKEEDVYDFINPLFTEDSLEKGVDKYNFTMGKYGVKKGKDDIGYYTQYSDRWDIDTSNKLMKFVIDNTQKPFNIEGKIYHATSINEDQALTNYLTFDKNNPDIKIHNDFTELMDALSAVNEEPYDVELTSNLKQEDLSC